MTLIINNLRILGLGAALLATSCSGSDTKPDAQPEPKPDVCKNNPCAALDTAATCTNAADSGSGQATLAYTCECSTGYSDDGTTCADTDDCQGNPCSTTDAAATCVDALAPEQGYSCTCSDSFAFDDTTCVAKPCSVPRDLDADGSIAFPWGVDLDDDNDGENTYLMGGLDIDDSDASVTVASGDGSFSVFATYSLDSGGDPTGIVAGDFNDDGNIDLAISDQSNSVPSGDSGHVEVWLGNGDLSFTYASTPTVTVGGGRVSTGDFNKDGRLDLFSQGRVMLGTCDGSFVESDTFQSRISSPHLVDLNGDDNLDLVGASYGTAIVALLGAGDGTFSEVTKAFPGVQDVTVGFLDGDGHVDIAATAALFSPNNYELKTFVQDSAGVLVEKSVRSAGSFHSNAVIGDIDNDGNSDVLVTDFIANKVNRFLGDGSGSIGTQSTVLAGTGYPEMMWLVDVDGDGNLDLLFADQQRGFGASRGDGAGNFAAPVFTVTGAGAFALSVADFNRDGKLDVAIVNITSGDFTILAGN